MIDPALDEDAPKKIEQTREMDRDMRVTLVAFLITFVIGWLAILLRCLGDIKNDNAHYLDTRYVSATGTLLSQMCTNLIWTLAFFAGGFFVGFLFGIPKSIETNEASTSASGQKSPIRFKVNTNLEDISDWLTKILVGATLTQITKVPPFVSMVAHRLSQGNVGSQAASFMAAIIVSYSILGFLSGYIGTRMFLTRAFSRQF